MTRTNSKKSQKTDGLSLVLRRGVAYLLDIAILFAVFAPVGFLIQLALGLELAETGPELARTILWNFSIPAWLYFIVSDSSASSATLGKRLLKLHVVAADQERVGFLQAVWRTAVKLLPWELVHIFGFAISTDLSQISTAQTVGLIAANVLLLVYVILLFVTRGRQTVHDFAAGTKFVMG